MPRFIALLFVGLIASSTLLAQLHDKKLEAKIAERLQGFKGEVGLYVKDLRSGRVSLYNADTVFPTASIVKVPILLGITAAVDNGQLSYDSNHVYRDSLLYAGEDILGSFKDGEKIALKKIIMLMMTTSDNTASLWLQSLAGGGKRINELLLQQGLLNTYVNSRTPGREANRTQYGWGQTTPAEMGRLLEKIYRKEVISAYASEKMLRAMSRNFWDEDESLGSFPPYIEVFSKNGCVNASRSEAMIVNAPNRPFVFCIFTKNNQDQRWTHDNEAWTLARSVATLLWNYFEPNDKWVAPVNEKISNRPN
ncbi:MAG: serine hydrolase [Sphingomonadales bacterium]|nr:serine hydrolase [Sphingomonadales bacterium]